MKNSRGRCGYMAMALNISKTVIRVRNNQCNVAAWFICNLLAQNMSEILKKLIGCFSHTEYL